MAEDLLVEYVDLSTLTPYKFNARDHSDHQIEQIMKSMREFGFIVPMIVGKDNMILAGHGRYKAADRLNIKKGPIIRVDHLSDRQQKAYILADNKIGDNSRWNFDLLSREIDLLVSSGFDHEVLGFDEDELDAILQESEAFLPDSVSTSSGKQDVDDLGREDHEQDLQEPGTKPPESDVWVIDNHRFVFGNPSKGENENLLNQMISTWQSITGKEATHSETGETFSEFISKK